MGATDDRRDTMRAQVLLKVQYPAASALLADYLTDLGEGGLFIRTAVAFDIGQRIAFSLSFPGLLDPLELAGTVRWRSAPTPQAPEEATGVGVEIAYPSAAARQAVVNIVRAVERGPAPAALEATGPGAAAAPAGPTAPPLAAAGPPAATVGAPFRVLLVEDNQFVHDLFKHAVKRFHRESPPMGALEICSAGDGQEALRLVEQREVHLALIDHFLPVMSGSELVARMRGQNRRIPILVVSVGGEGVREAAMAAGADLYLDKPVLLKQLMTTLRLMLEKERPAVGA